MLQTPNWRDWYHFRHRQECFKSGTEFENYVSAVLSRFHDDFLNPAPAGSLGDGGCDGLADSGTTFYACYGQRPGRNAERELAAKIKADFTRGLTQWDTFTKWIFVTNAALGPEATKAVTEIQQAHGPTSERPLTIRVMPQEKLWSEIVSTLGEEVLNELFPGAPGIENIELADLLPLLDELDSLGSVGSSDGSVLPVPPNKMDFNSLSTPNRMEFNAGRTLAPRIDRWYEEASEPELYDSHGEKFRQLYRGMRAVTDEPSEVIERLYVSVAGANFRMDGKRANAAFAVVAYFFDSCHIFETPPASNEATTEAKDAPTH